ncbi:phage tail family protein [Aerococcaceae bacterium DSM 111022]|nr:phage tail family protein [Aerococcaceae bacterium DSM 111022]
MELKRVYFDDIDLSAFVFIDDVRKNLYNTKNVVVEVDFTIIGDVLNKMDVLNVALHTKESKFLRYNKLPYRKLLCKIDGEIELEVFKDTRRGTIRFVSDHNYWMKDYQDGPIPSFSNDSNGVITVINQGTAPTYPEMAIEFSGDNGYLNIVSPNGYLEFGSKEQMDIEDLPQKEEVMNEEMHLEDMDDWTKLTGNNNPKGSPWVPDYNKLNIGTGVAGHNEWGAYFSKSPNPKAGHYWNTWGYIKDFAGDTTLDPAEFNNFELQSRIRFEDSSGTKNNTGMYLIVLLDDEYRPVMTTSMYNVDANSNEVTVTAKVNDFRGGGDRHSKIIHTARFPNGFNGLVKMYKEKDVFHWIFDSKKNQTVAGYKVNVTETFKVGDIAYIRNSAQYGWHYNGTRHSIKGFTRGRRNVITGVRTLQGKKQYEISYTGVKIYWMNEEDLTANASGVGKTREQVAWAEDEVSQKRVVNTQLAGLVASKVLVIGGTWDNSNPFTHNNLMSVVVHRLNNDVKFKDITNTFTKGDVLTIDNKNNQVLLNGSTYQDYFDPASQFFDIDFGETDLQVIVSDWAQMPTVNLQIEERFR